MKLQSYLIGVLILGGLSFAFGALMVGLGDPITPDDKTDDSFYNVDNVQDGYDYVLFQKIDRVNKDWNYTMSKINQMAGSNDDTEYEDYRVGLWQRTKDFVLGGYGATKGTASGVVGSVSLATTMLSGATNKIPNMPQWVTSLLYGVIIILLGLLFWKFITGREI